MNIRVISIGSSNLDFAERGVIEYVKRIQRFANLEIFTVKEGKRTNEDIMKACEGRFVIVLDEHGTQYDSNGFASFLEHKRDQSISLAFVIGGPDGHTKEIQERADHTLSLSLMTFPHDLAKTLLLEAIYRSLTIMHGHPYHRS